MKARVCLQPVILCESRESRKTLAKNGPPLFSEGEDGAGKAPHICHSLRKQGIQKDNQPSMDPRFAARVTKVWLVNEGAE